MAGSRSRWRTLSNDLYRETGTAWMICVAVRGSTLRPDNHSTANCHIELSEKSFLCLQGSSEQKAIQRFLFESK
jgi:hypothetical protein